MSAWFNLDKSTLPSPADALPGRDEPIVRRGRHTVLGTPTALPFPGGIETACFALGCFWGAERLFWQADGVYTTAVGYTAGITPNPTYQEVCTGATAHTEAVLVGFDPAKIAYAKLLKIFWEGHDPTQGMGQGNDRGTQYRSGIYYATASAARCRRELARHLPAPPGRRRARRDHDGDSRARLVLLRRGVPSAIPGQEPRRLLRARRHRRELPTGRRDRLGGDAYSPS